MRSLYYTNDFSELSINQGHSPSIMGPHILYGLVAAGDGERKGKGGICMAGTGGKVLEMEGSGGTAVEMEGIVGF